MDTKKKILIFQSRLNEWKKPRKADQIFKLDVTQLKKMREKDYI
jgi:hypothetical protein